MPDSRTSVILWCALLLAACSGSGDSTPGGGNGGGDSAAPTVTINSPTSDDTLTVNDSSLNLGGVASDNNSVASVSWSNDRGGDGTATGTNNWSVTAIPLMAGDNLITVTAVDGVGLTGSDTILVTLQQSVVTVTIQSPTNSSTLTTSDATVTLAGSAASVSSTITGVEWSTDLGDSGTANGTTSWSTSAIDLEVGSNTITVTANDDQGMSGSDTIAVTRVVPGSTIIEGKDLTPPSPGQMEPTFGNSYVDPAYGLTVRKVSDATGTRFNRNIYSRIEPENSDGSRFLTYHGSSEYRVYDRQTLALVRRLVVIDPDGEPQWHPTNRDLIRYTTGNDAFSGELKLYEVDVTDPEGTVGSAILDLTGRLPWPNVDQSGNRSGSLFDIGEGSPSRNGNRYAWAVLDRDENMVGLVAVDISTNSILGTLNASDWAQYGDLDHLSISPSGRYIVVSFDTATVAYNVDFSNPRQFLDDTEHSDIAINAAGNDALVIIDFESGDLKSVDLETGQQTILVNIFQDNTDTSLHISGKAFAKPGWAVVSTYNCRAPSGSVGWACNKVFAIELKSNPRILNLAHTYNCGRDYWTEPHAVPSRDLRRVYYNSDWGSCGIDAEIMMIDVPAF